MSRSRTDIPGSAREPLRRLRKAAPAEAKRQSSREFEQLANQLERLTVDSKPTNRFAAAVAARKSVAGMSLVNVNGSTWSLAECKSGAASIGKDKASHKHGQYICKTCWQFV